MEKDKLVLHKAYDFETGGQETATAIFIHGIAADSSSFREFFDYLREEPVKGLRVVAYDLLGVGESPKSDEYKYDLDEQMVALENSLARLGITTPVVVCGHSMGTMLAERMVDRYSRVGKGLIVKRGDEADRDNDAGADENSGAEVDEKSGAGMDKNSGAGTVARMVLISPPVYTADDIKNPIFKVAIKKFCDAVSEKDKSIVKSKVFKSELKTIVSNPDNYQYLERASVPTTMIYGKYDKIVAAFNYPKVMERNSLISAVETEGGHGVAPEKFEKIVKAIKGEK